MVLIITALLGVAVIITLAAAYSAAALLGSAAMSWPIFAGWLGLLVTVNAVLAFALWRGWRSLSLASQVLGMLWLIVSGWYWTVAPLFFFLVMNIDGRQLAWTSFAFIWEVPAIGGGIFLTLSLLFLRPIAAYFDRGRRVANPPRLYTTTFWYPTMISLLLFALSVFGYGVGTWQLATFAGLPVIEQGKNMVNGVVISIFVTLLLFLIIDAFLGKVRERLKKEYSVPQKFWRSIRTRFITTTMLGLLGSVGLLGLLVFDAVQTFLGDEAHVLLNDIVTSETAGGRFLSGLAMLFALALAVILFIGQALTRALRALAGAVQHLEAGHIDVPSLQTGDEIEVLSHVLRNKFEELAAQRNQFRDAKIETEAIFEGMGEGLMVTNQDTRVVRVNRQAQRLIGWSQKEMVGKRLRDIVQATYPSGRSVGEKGALEDVLASGKSVYRSDYTYARNDGSRFPVAVTAAALVLNQKIIGAVLLFRDITREKVVEKAKTEFVSLASHQLRTPLTAIQWYIELLLRGVSVTNEQRRDLEKVSLRARRMSRLVTDLLNVTRLDTGRLKVDPVSTDLVEFVNSVIDELLPFAQQRECTVTFHRESGDPVSMPVDRTLLRQVLHNLLTNAVKYSRPGVGSRVWVELEKNEAGNFVISVQDNGMGVPEDVRSRVFDKFFRASNAVAQETEGTGLGLYVAKKVMKAAGGNIWFESKEGRGTTFFVEIPREGMREKDGLDLE